MQRCCSASNLINHGLTTAKVLSLHFSDSERTKKLMAELTGAGQLRERERGGGREGERESEREREREGEREQYNSQTEALVNVVSHVFVYHFLTFTKPF